MDPYSFPPVAALLDAASTALFELAALLEPLAGSAAAAASVFLVTLVVRAALIPAGIAQAKAEQTRSRLAPRLRALQQRFARDRERLQRETMKLYSDEGASPFAGCLPLLAQAPVVAVVYALFAFPTIAGHANALMAEELFGVSLGTTLVSAIGAGAASGGTLLVFGAVIAVIVVVAELTRRAFRPPQPSAVGTDAAFPAAPAMNRVVGVLPFTTAVIAVFVPLAAGLYLATTVTWTLVQRVLLRRSYPLTP